MLTESRKLLKKVIKFGRNMLKGVIQRAIAVRERERERERERGSSFVNNSLSLSLSLSVSSSFSSITSWWSWGQLHNVGGHEEVRSHEGQIKTGKKKKLDAETLGKAD